MKIICHGGAGHTPKVQDGVDKAAEEGWKILKKTKYILLLIFEDFFQNLYLFF